MEFVRKKVNIDIFSPFITSRTKKGHTHSNKSSAKTDKLSLSVSDHAVGLALKGFTVNFC